MRLFLGATACPGNASSVGESNLSKSVYSPLCALRLRRRLGSTSGRGGGSASTSGSVVTPSLEDSLESSDSGVVSGTSSHSGSVSLEGAGKRRSTRAALFPVVASFAAPSRRRRPSHVNFSTVHDYELQWLMTE